VKFDNGNFYKNLLKKCILLKTAKNIGKFAWSPKNVLWLQTTHSRYTSVTDWQCTAQWRRPAMYVQRNAVTSSCNYCCRDKTIRITYFKRVCSLRYPAWNAHGPYYHLWPVQLSNICLHYLTKWHDFRKNVFHI